MIWFQLVDQVVFRVRVRKKAAIGDNHQQQRISRDLHVREQGSGGHSCAQNALVRVPFQVKSQDDLRSSRLVKWETMAWVQPTVVVVVD